MYIYIYIYIIYYYIFYYIYYYILIKQYFATYVAFSSSVKIEIFDKVK